MKLGEKIQQITGKEFYRIAWGIFLIGCLMACIIYPVVTQAQAAVVFLRTTFPFEPPEEEKPDPETPDEIEAEQRLVSMLQKDDLRVIYEKMEETKRWQVVRMRVTGYCSCPKCCGKFSDGKTASSHRIRRGDVFVAADKNYSFGTEVIVPGYNRNQPVKVLDRGKAIKGNCLDVYFDSHRQAQKWGVKYMDVLVKIDD